MGKSDYKKINDNWGGECRMNNRASLNSFYDKTQQEQPSNGKKREKPSKCKSNHKHEYEKVLVDYSEWANYCLADHCKICGKINIREISLAAKTDQGYYCMLSNDEALEHPKYKGLPIIKLDGKPF